MGIPIKENPLAKLKLKGTDNRRERRLKEGEYQKLIGAAGTRKNPWIKTVIQFAVQTGMRRGEILSLQWDQVDLKQGLLHINRAKSGSPSTHTLRGPEIRALRRLQREYTDTPYVFVTERKGPLTTSLVRKTISRAGLKADINFPVHPHMLRHACGFFLANEGHDTRAIQHYMGHKNIQHTVRYTELSSDRFNGFWKD